MVTTETLIITGIPLVYLIFTLSVGLWSSDQADQETSEGYVAGNRGIGLFVMYFIMCASIMSAFAFLGGPGFAYSKGAAALYIVAYGGFGMLLWYLFGPKVARLGRKKGYMTQADFISDRYNSPLLSALMAIASVAAFIPYLVVQMKGVAFILTEASGGLIPFWLSAAIPFVIIGIYVFTSGVMGVGWSHVLQGIMMFAVAWILGLYLPFKLFGGIQPMFEQIATVNPSHLLVGLPEMSMLRFSSFIIVSALGFVMWPHLFMRAYTAEDSKTLKETVVLYPTFQFILFPIILIGFAGVLIVAPSVISSPERILPYLLTTLEIHPVLIGLFFAGALAATMSTADSILHASVSITTRDFYKPLFNKDIDGKKETKLMKIAVFPTLAVAYYFAMFSPINIVPLQAAAYGAVVQFLPLMLGAFYWPRSTKEGALSGLFAGSAVTVLFTFFVASPLRIHPGFWGLITTTVVFVVVSLITEVEDIEFAREIIRESRPDSTESRPTGETSPGAVTDGGTMLTDSKDEKGEKTD